LFNKYTLNIFFIGDTKVKLLKRFEMRYTKAMGSVLAFFAFSLILAFTSSVSAMSYDATYAMTDLWNGNLQAEAEENDKISISSPVELVYFSSYVNSGCNTTAVTFYLSQNITLDSITPNNHTAIGYYTNADNNAYFLGVFDGCGFEISGINISNSGAGYQGLFGRIGNGAIVKNVRVVNGTISTSGMSTGGIVGYNFGGAVVDCCYSGSITVSGFSFVGGIVGDNQGTVDNCINIGTVTSSGDCVGGIAGYGGGAVTNSKNTGNISGDTNVGGIVGSLITGSVDNCINSGKIVGEGIVGGIVGYLNKRTVQNCCNTGDVTSDGNMIGGIVGYLDSTYATVEKCCNDGNVSGNKNIGGVAGFLSNTQDTMIGRKLVQYCCNTGNVFSTEGYAGGVAGYSNFSRIYYSYNLGDIRGGGTIGGVVGYINTYAEAENCYSIGNISGSGNMVGGVVGFIASSGAIRYSYYDTDRYTGNAVGETANSSSVVTQTLGKSTEQMQGTALCTGETGERWTNEHWLFTNGNYPQIVGSHIISVEITSLPSIRNYTSETLPDWNDALLNVRYADGSNEIVNGSETNELGIIDYLSVGNKQVKLIYKGCVTSNNFEVVYRGIPTQEIHNPTETIQIQVKKSAGSLTATDLYLPTTINYTESDAVYAICTVYDNNGRMLGVTIKRIISGANEWEIEFLIADISTVRVFFLDNSHAPICGIIEPY
jgi:hypothetical protein